MTMLKAAPPPKLSAHASSHPLELVQQPRKCASKKSFTALSDAAKASRTAANEEHQLNDLGLEAEFAQRFTDREEDIVNLADKYKKSKKYIRQVLENGVHYTGKHALSIKNAIMHDLSKKAKENGEASNVRNVQISGDDYQAYKDSLSEAEKARLTAQLVEDKGHKLHGVRATNKAVAMDAMQNSNQVGKVIINLHSRTGVHTFSMFSCGHPDNPAMPCFVDSDNARQFFQDVLDMSVYDLVRKYELWCCNQDKSVRQGKEKAALCKFISDTVEEGLRKATGNKTLTMAWHNYKIDIVHKHSVELAGWPTKLTLVRPSKLRGEDVRLVVDRLRNGTMRWVRLTRLQRKEVAVEVEKLRESGATKPRQERSDKNQPRRPRAKKGVHNESDKDDDNAESDKDDDDAESDKDANDAESDKDSGDESDEDDGKAPVPIVSPFITVRPTAAAQSPASSAPIATVPTATQLPADLAAARAMSFGGGPTSSGFAHGATAIPVPGTAPITFGSQLPYDEGFNWDFAGWILGRQWTANHFGDNASGWRLNTSNREDGWMDASNSAGGVNGGNALSIDFDGGGPSLVTGLHGSAPSTQTAAGYAQGTASLQLSAPVYAQGAAYAQSNGGMSASPLGTTDDIFPAALVATGARPAAAAAGPSMSVFSVATNNTATKRKRAEGDAAEKPKKCASKKKDVGEGKAPACKARTTKKKATGAGAGTDAGEHPGADAQPRRKKQKKTTPAAAVEACPSAPPPPEI
ncbi:hypothetical protein B0H19DRAFT_1257879 [Mycena capillaripes]|nr:hypothetical protein B0H19DRAFT_1257879 [Mycena capillaripes]